MPRFFRPPPWRFVITNKFASTTLTLFDRLCYDATLEIDLNTPTRLTGSVPADNFEVNEVASDDHPVLSEGDRLMYAFRRDGVAPDPPWTCRAAGTIFKLRDIGDAENPRSQFTVLDPWAELYRRPCVDENGDLPGPSGLNFLDAQGPGGANWQWGTIALALLKWSIDAHGPIGLDAGDGSRIGEGDTYQDWSGTADFTGFLAETDETEWNVQRGKSVGQVWDDLCASDKLDLFLYPLYDPVNRPSFTHELNVCAEPRVVGQALMVERPNAIFAYDKPPRTLSRIEREVDGLQRANSIVFYNRFGIADSLKQDAVSIARYGEYWYEQNFPDVKLDTDQIARWAEGQLNIRKHGWRTVVPTPHPQQPPEPFLEFNVGDFVPVYSSNRLREILPSEDMTNEFQRMFGMTLSLMRPEWNEKLEAIRVSAEGIPA